MLTPKTRRESLYLANQELFDNLGVVVWRPRGMARSGGRQPMLRHHLISWVINYKHRVFNYVLLIIFLPPYRLHPVSAQPATETSLALLGQTA